jgi:polyisoprenoid-binding protein YceI
MKSTPAGVVNYSARRQKETNVKVGIIGTTLLACVASSAFGAPSTYELNKDHTDVTFRISHAGFTMKHGSFTDISGTLKLDAEHLDASSVDISVATNSIATNHGKRDQDLQSAKWLDAALYPTMHFVSAKVVRKGANKLDVAGTLTLHGVSRPFVLHATVNRIGASPFGGTQTAGFSATGTLKRSDYDIKGLIPMIGDEVAIDIDAEFAVPKQT